jgi:hypothetical protein
MLRVPTRLFRPQPEVDVGRGARSHSDAGPALRGVTGFERGNNRYHRIGADDCFRLAVAVDIPQRRGAGVAPRSPGPTGDGCTIGVPRSDVVVRGADYDFQMAVVVEVAECKRTGYRPLGGLRPPGLQHYTRGRHARYRKQHADREQQNPCP